jgi:signal transduction histidine kinase
MQSIISVLFLIHLSGMLFSQDSTTLLMRSKGDSLLNVIANQKNTDKRHELILSMLTIGADQDPIYTLELAKRLFDIGEKNKDKVAVASAWSYYGQGYRLSGNYVKALDYHYKAIREAELSENKSVLSQAYNQLAHIYKDREEFGKAIELYHIARVYNEQSKIKIYWPYMNLGAVYLGNGQVDSSLYYSGLAYKGLLNSNKLSANQYLPYILGNIGAAYSFLKKEKEAMDTFRLALAIINAPDYSHLRQKQLLYTRIANHFRDYGRQDSCIYYAKLSIACVENTVFSYLHTKPAQLLSQLYEKQDADSAVKYLKLFLKTNEVINSTRVTQQLQMKAFEENQRSLEVEQARKEYRSRIQIYVLSVGMLSLLLFAGLLFRNNKEKQKSNLILQRQKKELELTLDKLSSTQQQLVHAEKMASLGELTAGIAHEIQNPLNFVNNFSEVSIELIEDVKGERAKVKGERDEALEEETLNDIAANLEKIRHHGKRADAIVKGMLAHSRTSTGQKEPTDINALCDEYLRLAYHGLKAKDPSFNASFHFEPDQSLPKVSVVPQDMGRVLLNLINNAFQAVAEKQKIADENYNPEVKVSTKLIFPPAGGLRGAEIRVKDNGPGIPDGIKEKIFQPFFTTKPTGQGTGLGLSLSYDIVKAHGGELKMGTKEGEGSSFIVQLPVS